MGASKYISLDNIELPTPPVIGVKILEAVKKNDNSEQLSKIISMDPALTAKILQIANSSFYALPSKVDNIQKAITVLGTNTLKNIALSFIIAKEFTGEDEKGFDFNFFWRRSITAAAGAECLVEILGLKVEDLFAAALLQDIGVIVLYLLNKDSWGHMVKEKIEEALTISEAEKRHFGFDHQELGAEILKKWGLSEKIHHPIRYHHSYQSLPPKDQSRAYILMLSDKISSIYHGSHSEDKIEEIKISIAQSHGLEAERIEEMVDAVAAKSLQIMSLFDIAPGEMKPFSQILQEANAELGKLNLSYEQLLAEYKQAKESAEHLAAKLKAVNKTLKELAYKDGLTGLNNHRQFQELMDMELSRAKRYQRPFSIILFDLDHFKSVNDTYGHPVGDLVLKTVSRILDACIRESDSASRYGGEEFAIILPETDLKGTAILAERIRKSVAEKVVETGETTLSVTISCGFTSYDPEMPETSKADLIATADSALYLAKENGRNRISFIRISKKKK